MKFKSPTSKLPTSHKTKSTARKTKSTAFKSKSTAVKSKSKPSKGKSKGAKSLSGGSKFKLAYTKPAIKSKDLTVSEAIKIANDYFVSVFPNVKEMVVEEIEMSREGKWLITIGYTGQTRQAFGVPVVQRMYKRFTVDNTTGQVISMKIVHAI